jgi:hypothetical protein
MAEFALIRLKRDGINVESSHVGYAQEPAHHSGLNSIVFPYNTDYGFGAEVMRPEMARVEPFGGVLYSTENNKHERRSLDDDLYSSDVKMVLRYGSAGRRRDGFCAPATDTATYIIKSSKRAKHIMAIP